MYFEALGRSGRQPWSLRRQQLPPGGKRPDVRSTALSVPPAHPSCFNWAMQIAIRRKPLLLAAALALPTIAQARQPEQPVREEVQRLLDEHTRGFAGDVRLTIGPIDPRNRLPECANLNAFLPAGARAWGSTSVGVRCTAPIAWTIYVPAKVAVFGDYLVVSRPLQAGQLVTTSDLERRHGDLAAEGDGAMLDAARAVGLPARIAIAAGQPLRSDMLRIPPVVKRGEQVRVVTQGPGFSVANEGRALNDAAEGQQVRVRLGSGKVLVGTARHDGVVELAP